MGIASRRWGARSRPLVALVVLTAWFGTLLVAAPLSPAAAASTTVTAVSGPTGPSNDPAPTFAFTLPLDTTTTGAPVFDPVTSATSTVTITTTHSGRCRVSVTAPSTYDVCGSPNSPTGAHTYSPPALTTAGSYTFYVHAVETTTTSTTVERPNSPPSTTTGTPTVVVGSPDSSPPAPYVFDNVAPTLTLDTQPTATGKSTTPTWTFTAEAGATVACRLVGGGATVNTANCLSPYSPTLSVDGPYSFAVTATDAAGNTSTVGSTYTLDRVGPTFTLTSGPTGPGKNANPSWTVTANGGEPVSCELFLGAAATPTATIASCTGFAPGPLADGSYTLKATATDVNLNTSTATVATYDLDTAPPTIVVDPANRSTSTPAAGWTVTVGAGGLTPSCVLTSPTGSSLGTGTGCGQFSSFTLPSEGTYTLTATTADAAGNTATATGTWLYRAAPTVTVRPPQATGFATTIDWTVTAPTTSTVTCALTTPTAPRTPITCSSQTSPRTLLTAGDGTYTLTVTATDNATGAATSADGTYLLDTVAPAAFTVSGTSGARKILGVRWTWTATDVSTTCQLRSSDPSYVPAAPAACVSPYTTDLPGEGTWRLAVTLSDAAGNSTTSLSPEVRTDLTPPAAPGVSTATYLSNNRSPVWTLTGETNATFSCSWTTTITPSPAGLPGGGACTTGYSPQLPAVDGTYTLTVTQTDVAGNVSPTTARSYVLDQTAPTVVIASSPVTPTNVTTGTWTTTGEATATSQCRMVLSPATGGTAVVYDWSLCGRNIAITDAGDGSYVLSVRDTDAAGNLGAEVSSAPFVLDRSDPIPPTISTPTSPSQSTSVSWTVTSTDPSGKDFVCRFVVGTANTGAFSTCPGTVTTTAGGYSQVVSWTGLTAPGTYYLDAMSRDAAGNLSVVTRSAAYVVDQLAPAQASFTSVAGTGFATTATWSWTGEDRATAECQLLYQGTAAPGAAGTWRACTSPRTESLTAGDGSYALGVRLTDEALNTNTGIVGPTYVLDTVKPETPVVTGPSGPSKQTTVTWTYTTTEAVPPSLLCELTRNGTVVEALAPCTSLTRTLPTLTADGSYVLTVVLKDAAGNLSDPGASNPYVLDTTPPALPVFTQQPTGTDNLADVVWAFTKDADAIAECQLIRVGDAAPARPFAACGTPHGATLTYGDGAYYLQVRLTDGQGNTTAIVDSATYTLDLTPPGAPTVIGPGGTSNATSAEYSLSGPVEAGATAECRLNRDTTLGGWGSCSLPQTFTFGSDGSYVLEVRLTDQYGNLGPAGASQAFLLDTRLPTVPVVTAPKSPSSSAAPTFTFTSDADATNVCSLARGSVVVATADPCAGSFTGALTGLADGDYVLTVTTKDPAGNVATGTSAAYTYDTTKPGAPSVTGPAGPSQNRNPAFSWSAELGASPECSLQVDDAPATSFAPCSPPYAPTLTADGTWVLTVRVTDAAGNVSDPGSSGGYLLDTTPPPAPAVVAPTSPGRDLSPSWSAGTEAGSTTECRFSGPGIIAAGFAACTLPVVTAVNGDGVYTFEVRATDTAGNVSEVGVGTYLLDTTAPVAPAVSQPTGPSRSRAPSIAFTTETGTTGSCRLTRGSTVLSDSAACTSPAQLDLTGLPDGAYTLNVRAVDAAGNTGPAGTATYVLDTTAPAAPTYTLIPGSPSSDRAPVYAFAHESAATPACRITTPGGVVKDLICTSPLTIDLSGSVDGSYQLAVTAKDVAGNSSAPAASTFVLDSSVPAAPRVVGPATPGSTRTPSWKITAAAPTECRLLRGTSTFKDWAPCTASYVADLFGQPDAVYALEVRVIGTTASTYSRYRLDSVGPGAAVITAPPSPSTSRRAVWSVASAEVGATAECRTLVFGGVLSDWAPCAVSAEGSLYALDLTGLGDGTYSLAVRLTDGAGNVGSVATSDYVLDTSAPAAVGVVAPPSPGNDTTPTWTINSTSGVVLECRISNGQQVLDDFAPCAGSYTADLAGLPDGTYTLTVHALSAAGTPGPETTSLYVLDTTASAAPGTLSGPTGPSRDRAPSWTFVLASGSTATCKVTSNGVTYREGPCTSPFTMDLSNAPDGSYTLTVRAIDTAGNIGEPATAGYILRTVPAPTPEFSQQPGSPSSTTDPRWAFTTVRNVTAQCRLLYNAGTQEDWTTCTSPMTVLLTGKPDGRYTLQVRAVDVAGNTSSPISSDYVFDRTAAPLAVFLDTPATPGNDTTPTWTVSAPAAAVTTTAPALLRAAALVGTPSAECRLTTPRGVGSWSPCSGSYTATTTGDGTYLLEVRAVDSTGASGPASSSAYRLDTAAPSAATFTDQPPVVGNEAGFSWSWNDDPLLTVECRFTRPTVAATAFAPCASPYVAAAGTRGEGSYLLEVRAVDAAGNIGPVTAGAYRFDKTPPPAPVFLSRPAPRGTGATPTWSFAVPADTTATCIASRNGTVVAEGACNGTYALDLRGQQPADWTVSVRYVDTAGNLGPSVLGSYTLTSPALVRDRVDAPVGPGTSVGGPFSPRPPTQGLSPNTGGVGPVGSPGVAGPVVPVDALPGALARGVAPIKRAVEKVVKKISGLRTPGIPEGTRVPDAIKNVIGSTITKPQLPLALFFIVLLFLLVQNRIDRRDPKLAAAPLAAEPELVFGPRVVRVGGASA